MRSSALALLTIFAAATPTAALAAPIADGDAATLIVAVLALYVGAVVTAYALLARPERPEDAVPSSPRASSRRRHAPDARR